MKTSSRRSPVEIAVAGYETLLRELRADPQTRLPPERELAKRWEVSQAAVNRAAHQLVAAGRLRREGYKLAPMPTGGVTLTGSRIVVLTHRALRFPGLASEAALRGVQVEELFYIGRDSLRRYLREAAAKRVDGVIMRLSDGGWEWDAETAEFDRLRIPCVVCEEAPQSLAMAAEDWRAAGARLVGHLTALGHVELAFLGSLRRAHRSTVVRDAYAETCLRLGLAGAAARSVDTAAHTAEAVGAAFARLREQWPQTTALLLYDADSLPALLEAIRGAGLRVPADLSVVAVSDSAAARSARPGITCAGFDQRALGHLALDQICQQILHLRRVGRLAARQRLRLEPALVERASVRSLAPAGAPVAIAPPDGLLNRTSHAWSQDRATRLREVEAVRLSPHRLTQEARAGDFFPLDLRPLANRSLTRQNGWLGHLPLLHLPAGRQAIHGVPFDIVDERRNEGAGAIVLRAQRPLTQADQPLPLSVVVPVGRQVRAVFFLHGCGYAGEPTAFAWYDLVLESRRPVSVPLVAKGLGVPPPDAPSPNVQDWWSDFPQFEAPGVKHLVVTAGGDPFEYERYLYTLEWENPHPKHALREIRISSNPSQPATLGVLAITLLLA